MKSVSCMIGPVTPVVNGVSGLDSWGTRAIINMGEGIKIHVDILALPALQTISYYSYSWGQSAYWLRLF